jgi:tetratricopeptide (TPR) repeat protein
LNFRREPLRTKGLRLVLIWPVALREELMSGAPDLWSMRLLSPWADEKSMGFRDAELFGLNPSALPGPAMDEAPLPPAQQARYAAWRAHRDLNESLLSINDGLDLVGDLYKRRRWHEALDLAEWLEALLVQQDRSPEQQYALAGSQHWIGLVRSALGDRFGALEATQRATENLSDLARSNPSAFGSNLAGSLTNLSGRLSDVGRFEAAIDPAQEAVSIYRRLATEEPSVFESNLASSLNNLANRMSGIGKPELALPFALESAAIRRRLEQTNVPEDGLNLALSLRNLSTRLMETGHHSSALAAVQEAVVINRRLATSDPAIYERDLAMSLMGLAVCRNAVGQLHAAVEAAEEAVGIFSRLARDSPSVIEPDLAMSLWTSMRCFAATGATPLARARGNEALSIFTRLADALPEAFSRRRDAVVQELKILLQPSS